MNIEEIFSRQASANFVFNQLIFNLNFFLRKADWLKTSIFF